MSKQQVSDEGQVPEVTEGQEPENKGKDEGALEALTEAESKIKQARDQAAAYRSKLRAAEKQLQELESNSSSELDTLKTELAALKEQLAKDKAAAAAEVLEAKLDSLAKTNKVNNTDLFKLAVKAEGGDLDNLDETVKNVLEKNPELLSQTKGNKGFNPVKDATGTKQAPITEELYMGLTQDQRLKLHKERPDDVEAFFRGE